MHIVGDKRDFEQLKMAFKALLDREKNTDRRIHILSESTIDQIKNRKWSILCTLDKWVSNVTEPLEQAQAESIEVRKLYIAVVSILLSKESELAQKDLFLSFEGEGWWRTSIEFKDLLDDFKNQKKLAYKTYGNLMLVIDNKKEKEYIETVYNCAIGSAKKGFIRYGDFLKMMDIDITSSKSIYSEVWGWDKMTKDRFFQCLIDCYSPFFDFNAYARILQLHQSNSHLDIVLIAGGDHCWPIRSDILNTLPGEEVYGKVNDLMPQGSEDLSLDIIYNVLQAQSPLRETPYILPHFCTVF